MGKSRVAMYVAAAVALLCVGCATSPEIESRRQAIQADIDDILSQTLDPAEFGEPKRCLSDSEYRSFRALDNRHILFYGRRDKQWINTLRMTCSDLRHGYVIRVESFSARRVCDKDQFQIGDYFDWPWYRRWPWHWGRSWPVTGPTCTFGMFQPVTEVQVAEIEALMENW